MTAEVRAFQRRYQPRQIAAVLAAVIDGPDRVSIPEALRLAAAGALKDDAGPLPAFIGNAGTFGDYVAKERRRRRTAEVVTAGGENAAAALADRLVVLGEREVKRLENRSKQRKGGGITPAEIRETAGMIRELVKLAKDAGVRAPGAAKDEAAPADPADTPEGAIALALPTAPAPIV